MNRFTLPMSLTLDGYEAEWETEVFYRYRQPTRGMMRGEPDEPGYCEIIGVLATRVEGDTAGAQKTDGPTMSIHHMLSVSQMRELEARALKEHGRHNDIQEAA